MMDIEPTDINDVLLLKPRVFGDSRGFFLETFRASHFEQRGIDVDFVQDNLSYSRRGIVRGLHYQIKHPQAKLVSVVKGEVLDVAVDIRRDSPTFGQYVTAVLNEENRHQLYIPAGFAHGFAVLSDEAYFYYKCSDYYDPDGERGICWNDPDLDIDWQVDKPNLSEKDQKLPLLNEVPEQDLF